MRGAFIVIEGLDRSGKSTQTNLLHERIRASGRQVELFKFPDRTTTIGQMIDAYLRSQAELEDHAIHLLFSANRWELAPRIEQSLKDGKTVLCDRYAFSGASFTSSKGLPLPWCKSPDVGLPAPDLVLFLDITPEKAAERGGYGEERYEKREMQERVREVFKGFQDEGGPWVEVDAGRPLEEVTEVMWGKVGPLVKGVEGELKRLWVDG
ncbi:thymidylate kinase [Calocera viscosa TUFC12733]|uniref:Thymidylate kinase n=1 Tax=Calocera viscosa (strain TUFC12733) TaxID=1330018 RepID=A0A167S9F7_CALVF|nr:thymidylate kinase [Calocera viscosa TUFC12733]